jgi:putative phosphoesterase
MKVAVLSDIHGNSWALEAVLTDITRRGIDSIFNLGDSLYGPLDPGGTYQLLRQYDIVHVSGNEDRLISESYDLALHSHPTIDYVLSELTTEAISWIRSLPKTAAIDDFFLCHGTPALDDEYLFEKVTSQGTQLKNQKELYRDINGIPQQVICCGHSHMMHSLQLPSGKYLVNPGSVGLPAYTDTKPFPHKMESGNPQASYCIIARKETGWSIDPITLSYPWEKAAKCAERNNRSDWAKWLRTGRT